MIGYMYEYLCEELFLKVGKQCNIQKPMSKSDLLSSVS